MELGDKDPEGPVKQKLTISKPQEDQEFGPLVNEVLYPITNPYATKEDLKLLNELLDKESLLK